ncbi:MAG: glycosyltransferase family 39 protein [Dehalococcoidales bacterium]
MKKISAGFLTVCVMFGAAYFISPGFALCILLSAAFYYLVCRNTVGSDRRFVLFVVSVAILLRVACLILLQYKCFSLNQLDIFGDAQDNIIQGINISESIRNMKDIPVTPQSILSSRYNTHSMTLFNGIYFLLFGNDIVSLKYLNVLAISATAWLIYDIAKKIYSSMAGRIALVIVLFWPTVFLWSITDLKESHLLFTLTCAFWCLGRSAEAKRRIGKAALIMLSALFAFYFVLLKIKLMMPIFILFVSIITLYNVLYYGFSRNSALTRKMLYISIISAVAVMYKFGDRISQAIKGSYELILHYHIGFLNSGGWNVDLIGDKSQNFFTVQFIAQYVAKAWFFFFLEPLPWHFYSYSLMATYPIMLVWYIIVAFSIVGVIRVHYEGRAREVFAMLVFSAIYITVVGMSVANIGTIIRFRDVMLPVVAVFAAIGISGMSGMPRMPRATEERCRNTK